MLPVCLRLTERLPYRMVYMKFAYWDTQAESEQIPGTIDIQKVTRLLTP